MKRAWKHGASRAQLLSNPHSPDAYRVNGIVRNVDPWYAAFHVKPGDALYLAPDQTGARLVSLPPQRVLRFKAM